jgi:peptidoglycan/xylan/chitin deacetylase (PgdA/CDA1 family)
VPTQLYLLVKDDGIQSEYHKIAELPPAATWTQAAGEIDLPSWAVEGRILHVIGQPGWLETDAYDAHPTGTAPATTPPHPALISITIDGGWNSAYTLLIPQMNQRGIKGTHFIVSRFTNTPGYQSDYITVTNVQKLIDDGHEICSHTLWHKAMTQMTPAEVTVNLTLTKTELETIGAKVTGFVPPFGYYTPAIRDEAKSTYAYFRTVKAGLEVLPYNVHELYGLVVTYNMTVAELEEWVKKAETANGGWLILVVHRASMNASQTDAAYVKPEVFGQMLDMMQKRKVVFKPMGEVLGTWKQPPKKPPVVVEGGKSLEPPKTEARIGKPAGTDTPAAGDDGGCAAGRGGPGGAWLVLLATLLGWMAAARKPFVR